MPRREVTFAQAAELLGVTKRTVRRYFDAGKLPGAHLNKAGAFLVPVSEVESMRKKPNPTPSAQTFDARDFVATVLQRDQLRDALAEEQRAREVAEVRAEERGRQIQQLEHQVQTLTRAVAKQPGTR